LSRTKVYCQRMYLRTSSAVFAYVRATPSRAACSSARAGASE
jgi:hypothetical protein